MTIIPDPGWVVPIGFKHFTMMICEVIWIFTNYLWKTVFTTPAPGTSIITHCNYAIDYKHDWFVIQCKASLIILPVDPTKWPLTYDHAVPSVSASSDAGGVHQNSWYNLEDLGRRGRGMKWRETVIVCVCGLTWCPTLSGYIKYSVYFMLKNRHMRTNNRR